MSSTATCIFVVLLLLASAKAAEIVYTYSNQTAWDSLPGSYCDGARQSPIDIPTAQLVDGEDFGLTQLVMSNWDVSTKGTWMNDGHTVLYSPENDVTTATHLGTYNLLQLHFHWGPNDNVGSEHLVDKNQYSGELHFVHTKGKMLNESDLPGDALTVIGVLLRADPSIDITDTVWDKFAASIPQYEENTTLSGIVLNDMLPRNLSYYYYNGSLTTPLCNEIVQWVLLRYPVSVPADFLNSLRLTAKDSNGTALVENYRDVLSLNGRQVYSYIVEPAESSPQPTPSPTPSSATTPISTVALLLLVVMIALVFIQ